MDWYSSIDWARDNPFKLAVSVTLGIVLAVALFLYTTLAGALAEASEDFDTVTASDELGDRSSTEVEQSIEGFLATEEQRLRLEYEQQLAGVALDEEVQKQIEQLTEEIRSQEEDIPNLISPTLPDEMFTSILLIGADASGFLADVVIDVLLPADGSAPMMVSLPRDLYVYNHCVDRPTKLNAGLGGCVGFASGPELLALNVGTFTGVEVDHYARVNFDGFAALVDRLGGVNICVGEYAVRDEKAQLEETGPGCVDVGGDVALGWVRSRNPEKLIDGEWERVNGSDFDRQVKQQEVLFQFAESLRQYSSVGALTTALNNLASVVRLDSGFSPSQAASIAFRYRSLGTGDIARLRQPVADYRTRAGAQVLIPTRTFNEVLAAAYSPASVG